MFLQRSIRPVFQQIIRTKATLPKNVAAKDVEVVPETDKPKQVIERDDENQRKLSQKHQEKLQLLRKQAEERLKVKEYPKTDFDPTVMDYYNSALVERGEGSLEKPTEVPSAFNARIVGCDCHPENESLNWFWVHEGRLTCCDVCGHYYKLVRTRPSDKNYR